MNSIAEDLTLYAVTDRTWLGEHSLTEVVEQALQGGATMVQLRDKKLSDEAFLQEARKLKEVCAAYHVPLIINDRAEIALQCDADGVHVGQSDMSPEILRRLLGPDKIVGVSVHNLTQALKAEESGADYLGAGAVFSTQTKSDTTTLSLETLAEICQGVRIPVCAIGGVQQSTIPLLAGTCIQGVAVVSALFAAADIRQAAQELRGHIDQHIKLKSKQ